MGDYITDLEGYTFFMNKDVFGYDLEHLPDRGMGEVKKVADSLDHCLGFNTLGYLKSKITNLRHLPNKDGKISGIYIKNGHEPKELLGPIGPEEHRDRSGVNTDGSGSIQIKTVKHFSLATQPDLSQCGESIYFDDDEFIFLPNVDCKGYDYYHLPNKPMDELVEYALSDPVCMGFTSDGWFKFLVSSQFLNRKEYDDEQMGGLYIHKARYLEFLTRQKNVRQTTEVNKETETETATERIPRIIHFIWFSKGRPFNLIHLLGIKTAHYHNPDYTIYLHCDAPPTNNKFFNAIRDIVKINLIQPVEYLNGKYVQAFQHKADYLRLQQLYQHGGIYLDLDILSLKPLDKFLSHRMVMGYERTTKMNVCNAVIMTEPKNIFIQEWLHVYKKSWGETFVPWWLGHSTIIPFKLADKYPDIIHLEPNYIFYPFLWYDHSMLAETDSGKSYEDSYTIQFWETELEKTNLIPRDYDYFLYKQNAFTRMFSQYMEDIPGCGELLERMKNYTFYPNKDSNGYDCKFIQSRDLLELLKICDEDEYVIGFNTGGCMKYRINDKLEDSNGGGLYVRKDRVGREPKKFYNVKLITNWCNDDQIKHYLNRLTKGYYCWNNIVLNDYGPNADFFVILNYPQHDGVYYDPARTIVFQMEPMRKEQEGNYGIKSWGKWAFPDKEKFMLVADHRFHYNNLEWHLKKSYSELMSDGEVRKPDEKAGKVSTIISDKVLDPGHVLRIGFLRYIEERDTELLDVYGQCQKLGLKSYRGTLPDHNKNDGVLPYKYVFACENNTEYNYFTEKLVDAIVGEALCFYWGCPNVGDYLPEEAFIRLELKDYEHDYQLVKRAIENNEWERRIGTIREAKRKILTELQFCPRIEKIINTFEGNLMETFFDRIYMLKGVDESAWNFKNIIGWTGKYREVFQDAIDNNCQRILVIDQDTNYQNLSKFNLVLQNLLDAGERIKWEVLCLGGASVEVGEQVGDFIYKLDEIPKSGIYAYRQECFQKFIEKEKELEQDNGMILKECHKIVIYPFFFYLEDEEDEDEDNEDWAYDLDYSIHCINLERRTDRKEKMRQMFVEHGIEEFNFLTAEDGIEIKSDDERLKLFEGNDFNYRRGMIGCALSHLNLWKQLMNDTLVQCYLIMEDDIIIPSKFNKKLRKIIHQVSELGEWDIVYLGYSMWPQVLEACYDKYRGRHPVELKNLDLERYIGGFFGYFISKTGVAKLFDFIGKNGIQHGIDYLPKKYAEEIGLKQYEVVPHIIQTEWVSSLESNVDSDIQKDYTSVVS